MRQFCVFGNPIEHSKSPLIHNFAFSSLDSQIDFLGFYGRFLLQNPQQLRQTFFDLKLSGANVTVPFKEEAYLQSDEVRGIGAEIGSVNTLVLKDDAIVGYNTDAEGFYQTIAPYGFQTALLIGAGGSAKAIAYILRHYGISVTIINRSRNRLESFIKNDFNCHLIDDFNPQHFDLVVNATSAGLKDAFLPIKQDLLQEVFLHSKMAYDLIYHDTPFLKLAREMGIAYNDGKNMLIEQAVLAFELFCNQQVPASLIREKMKSIL